jgi:ABC-type cobalt transport system substrate-binding protein
LIIFNPDISPGSGNWPESLLFRLFKTLKGNIIYWLAGVLGKLDGKNPAKSG